MRLPCQQRLERMVADQKRFLVAAAYGDARIWDGLLALYMFEPCDRPALRAYILSTYDADGSLRPGDAGRPARRNDEPNGARN